MLELREVTAHYGRIRALKKVGLTVAAGEIVALIGSNGAGKTTTLAVISGLIRPTSGDLFFEGRKTNRLSPPALVRLGVIQAPEGRQLFGPLTVRENLEMGAYTRSGRKRRAARDKDMEEMFRLFPILWERRSQAAGTLSGGEQQMLALGRALMGAPKLLLLDEPSLGLAPMVVSEIFRVIRDLKKRGVTILLVEQNARGALAVSDRAYVLETGRIALSGASAELLNDEGVKKAFLGRVREQGRPENEPGAKG